MCIKSSCKCPAKEKKRPKKEKVAYSKKKAIKDFEDGSQAWCIVMCCFIVNVIVMGFLKCLGILIIELMKAFKATPADVSVLVSITSCLNCVAGPLACYLVVKFTARTIAFTGTVMVSLGLILSWFATSMNYLYFSIGVLVGFGSGLTYSPGLILIGNYFQKNRGMANGIVVSGSPVGGMIMPYMLNFLVRYLDCRGALLILGGLMLNAVVCTLSYRPYRKRKSTKELIVQNNNLSRDDLCEARKTEASLHLPLAQVASKCTAMRLATVSDFHDSDDSSGPEFIEVDIPSKNDLPNKDRTASSGSVIVYKINEKYGRLGRSKKRKPTAVKSKPPLWKKDDNLKNSDGKQTTEAGEEKNVFPSATGQSIQSKQSQTEIHPKNIQEKRMITHPFQSLIRRNVEDAKLKSTLKNRSSGSKTGSGTASNYPQSTSPIALSPASGLLQSNTNSNAASGCSADNALRNRRPNKDQTNKKKDLPSVSTKKLSPYILSLDHSCVIMWSNENLAKNRNQSSTILRMSAGSEHKGRRTDENGDGTDKNLSEGDSLVNIEEQNKRCGSCLRFFRWIRNSPLKNGIYLVLLFSNSSTAIATTNILLLIPALGEYRGLSKAEYSTTYLIISVADMVARLLGAFISDRGYLTSKSLFAGGLFFAGLCSLFIAFTDTFLTICIVCSLFGLSSGFHIGIYGTLLAEIVGIELLHVGYAFCMILNGVLQFTFIYVSGQILSSNSDAFTGLYVFYGIVLIFGGLLWLIPPIFFKNQKEKSDSGSYNESEETENYATNCDEPKLNLTQIVSTIQKPTLIKSASENKQKIPSKTDKSSNPVAMSNISLY